MAAQVRGYGGVVAAAAAAVKEPRLKLERRNGSQSLCSSSSELQDSSSLSASSSSSSSSSSSPSSSSTSSLASSTVNYTTTTKHQEEAPSTKNATHTNYRRQKSSNASVSAAANQRKQPPPPPSVTWRRSGAQLSSSSNIRSVPATVAGRSRVGSLSSESYSSSSGSNESSRSNSSKLAAPPITAAAVISSHQQQQRRSTSATATATFQQQHQQRSSALSSRRAAIISSSVKAAATNSRPTRHLQLLHYGSLSSITSQQQQQVPRRLLQSNQATEGPFSSSSPGRPKITHQSLSSSLLERFDVRGQQRQHQSILQQQQQQVRQTRSCSVQQQLRIKATGSSLASPAASIAASSSAAANRQLTASSATTNSRLRQATLYARRHSHITPAQAQAPSTRSNTRCPLIIDTPNNSTTNSSSSIVGHQANRRASSAHAAPARTPSQLRISRSRVGPSNRVAAVESTSSFRRLGQSHKNISSSAFDLASSLSRQQHQHRQFRLQQAVKRAKAADNHYEDSPVARDLQHRSRSAALIQRGSLPISTKSQTACWRSNLHKQQIPSTKMTTTLAAIKFTSVGVQHSPGAAAGAASKKPGDRSDGRSSSSSNSSSAASDSSDATSDCGSSNEENVPVTRNHLATRATDSSTVDGDECENINNRRDDNGHHQQVIIENLIESANNIVKEIAENNQLLAASAVATPKISALAVAAVAEAAVAVPKATAVATDRLFDGGDGNIDTSCLQPLNTSDGILVSREFNLNIVQNNNNNNNNNNNQTPLEENIAKRPLSDIENNDCDKLGHNNKQDKQEMTNVKIKIQRKLSIAPDVPIRTEPICLYYDLEARPFARGKFAQVKRCISKSSKQCFAAKCIKKRRRLVDIRHEIMLEIEALKLAYFTDHIVKLYEVFETPTEMILILEMANGGELQRVIDDEETIDEQLVKRMIRQILEGLVQLHDNDIAHLDIKPQNLLLTEPFPGGDVKLCDFGISRRITKDCEIREICGTPDYVAPEILRYDPIGLATDMWSLGVLTYVLLTGYSPFGSENRQQTFCNITQATLDFPSEIFYKISEEAVDFIQKLIVREPSERLTSQQARNHPWLCQ